MTCSIKISSYGIIYMLGSFQFGFTLNFGGIPIEGLKKNYPNWDFNIDDQNISFYLNFASLFGSIGGFAIWILYYYTNSKKALSIFNSINCVLWFMYFIFTPDKFYVGIILRCLQGVVSGGFACITPVLMTNISPDETVGMLGCMNQFGIVFGMILFSIVGTFCHFHILAIIAALFDILQAGFIWTIPNKIIDKDKKDKKETLFQKKYMKNLFIALMIMIFQQFCGVNALNDNLTSIMSNTGIYIDSNLQAALSSLCQLLSTFIAAFNMDGVGRRNLWVFSTSTMVVSQILYIIALKVVKKGWFQAFSVFVYYLSFGHGLGPIPWFIVHDLFPRSLRLNAQTFVTFVNMICSFGVTYLFPIMKKNIDEYIIMIIFMCITIISIPFGLHFIPKINNSNEECLTLI